jgi:hypothetical protein
MASNNLPTPLALTPSMGFGDRIGVSTPGHIKAMRDARLAGKVAPIFAQQSVRENDRTGRTPAQVMADAQRAVDDAGWDLPWGADGDHLKNIEDIKSMMAAGFCFFTIDPSDHVNDAGMDVPAEDLDAAYKELFEDEKTEGQRLLAEYVEAGTHTLPGGLTLDISREELQRAALIYWKAIKNTIGLYGQAVKLWTGDKPFDLEMSVDETEAPTSHAAHYLVAVELKRAGVQMTSLAPRFVGRFEKGIDYIGDLAEFEEHLKTHAAIAQAMGDYKLSVHSGSDKFSIYPLMARYCNGAVHLKTAGTSYLEALRIPARHDPDMFREMARLARKRFPESRATYHLTTDFSKVADPDKVADNDLERAFLAAPESDEARQVMHVAFGDIARHAELGPAFRNLLDEYPEEHAEDIAKHMKKHFTAFLV